MNTDPSVKAEITAVYEAFIRRFEDRDLEGLLALYCEEADPILVGTGVDEVRVGLEQVRAHYERNFAQSEAMKWKEEWFSASASGRVAWLAAEGAWDARLKGREVRLSGRLTIVLLFRDDRWQIVHSHASEPAVGQEAGQSFPQQR